MFQTLDVARSVEVVAACPIESTDAATFNAALFSTAATEGSGLFVKALRRGLTHQHLEIPFYEHDLVAELQESFLLN